MYSIETLLYSVWNPRFLSSLIQVDYLWSFYSYLWLVTPAREREFHPRHFIWIRIMENVFPRAESPQIRGEVFGQLTV